MSTLSANEAPRTKAPQIILGVIAVSIAGWFLFQNFKGREIAAMNNKALKFIEQKQFAEARDLLEKAKLRAPDNASVFRNLGVAYEGLKDMPKSLEAFERSLTLKPYQPDVEVHVAIMKQELGKKE